MLVTRYSTNYRNVLAVEVGRTITGDAKDQDVLSKFLVEFEEAVWPKVTLYGGIGVTRDT